MSRTDFYKFATSMGVNGNGLDRYGKVVSNNPMMYGGYINPTIIEERPMNVAAMDVFSRLMMDRIIFLGTAIDDDVSNIINAQLLYLTSVDSDKDIRMYINSPGGVVHSGLSIIDTMDYIPTDVATTCMGMAASMASVILANGTKGKRSALPHSRVMIHQPMGGAEGQVTEMEISVNEIKKLQKELYSILADKSGQTLAKIAKDCDRDHYLTAQEALDYGLIDEVIKKK